MVTRLGSRRGLRLEGGCTRPATLEEGRWGLRIRSENRSRADFWAQQGTEGLLPSGSLATGRGGAPPFPSGTP